MIFVGTTFKCSDNSGAKLLKCIKILGSSKKSIAYLGETVKISVQKLNRKKNVAKKLYLGLINITSRKHKRLDGTFIKGTCNKVLMYTPQYKFLGTRVYGYITKEILKKNYKNRYQKVISYSNFII